MLLSELPLLSILIWLPILGAFFILILAGKEKQGISAKSLALFIAILTWLISLVVWYYFDNSQPSLQLVEQVSWIPSLGISYYLGVDGISLPLALLTTFITPLVIIAGWTVIKNQQALYMASFLFMSGLMTGVFFAADAILFYIFFEATLVPMFIIIGIWGGANRIYATLKFFLYTFLGSVFMFIALIYLGLKAGDFTIESLYRVGIAFTPQILIFLAFFASFSVKIPMWPVHTWLPDAHVQAPTGGSVILAAIMLKMGGYGFLRFSMPIVPDASAYLANFMIGLSLIAVIYIGFVAIVQKDIKKLIAYSSIAHMGFVTLGFFITYAVYVNSGSIEHVLLGLQGGMVQMVSHGFISAALFLCVGVLYDRMHTRDIASYGGVVNKMPVFAALFLLFAMANAGLPGTSGFVGEFFVVMGAWQAHVWIAILAATSLLWAPAFTLWMYKRVMFGKVANDQVENLQDLNGREKFILGLLAVIVLFFGIWPQPITDMIDPTLAYWLENWVLTTKL